MNSVLPSVRSLAEMFVGKTQEFINEIENVHMVWLEEIQQEANRMFSRDFNAEPELMPKTPSQKKNSRRRRVSAGRQEESQARRFSKGKRSNLRGSSVKPFNLIPEEEAISEVSTSKASNPPKPKRATRKNKQTKPEDVDESLSFSDSSKQEDVQNKKQELVKEEDEVDKIQKVNAETKSDNASITSQSPPKIRSAELVVNISAEDRLSAELANKPEASPGRTATKIAIAAADRRSRRSSARCSLKLRHSLAGLRHSMTQESIRRASRRSMLKRMSTRMGTSTSSSSNTGGSSALMESADEDNEEVSKAETEDIVDDLPEKASEASKPESGREVPVPAVERVTRSVAANSPKLAPPPLFCSVVKMSTPAKKSVAAARKQSQATQRSSLSTKRKAPDTEYSPTKRFSPPKKSQSTMKPSMRAFLHTVNKNQMLMMTPSSIGRTAVIKSFIKQATPLKVDPKINMGTVTKERHKLEALRKKQEQEEERMRKMEEEKKKKQEEQKRKREDRIKRVFEAKRQAEEKAKKKLAAKRQEELEQKKKLEEEARKKKIQQEEEKRQQELAAKKKAEEEEQQTRKALERQREQELERERQAAAERERVEKEKALALQREVERAAREKEKRELEEQRKALEDKRKLEEQQRLAAKEKALKEREEAKRREAAAAEAQKLLNKTVDLEYSVMKTPAGKGGLNVTVDLQEMSVQSYAITPDGGNKMLTISKNPEDYGMDQNSDDSTDDESAPRKPIPSWAEGANLKQLMGKQYFNPIDVDSIFGPIEPLRLENIFYKSKPRFFKRTSSAVWHSPPTGGK
ncbi:inner centromere protein A isoform X7 [Xiphophorus couchianus]|uniref:inner centromere protein A isoform X7 n=1 Tax=Xiphophorus couchianus TaxID=32473 RepID=UPI001016CA2A|nr:inner centromere protein isoform X7 [Xiphophorus couchianus]